MSDCAKCSGHGWWPIGDLCPMGPIDASEYKMIVVKCPWCGAGKEKDDRYDKLLKIKEADNDKTNKGVKK